MHSQVISFAKSTQVKPAWTGLHMFYGNVFMCGQLCPTDLLKLVCKFLWVHLHRRERVFSLRQVEHLDGIRKHGAHLFLFIGGIFTRLNTDKTLRKRERRILKHTEICISDLLQLIDLEAKEVTVSDAW